MPKRRLCGGKPKKESKQMFAWVQDTTYRRTEVAPDRDQGFRWGESKGTQVLEQDNRKIVRI